MSVTRQRLTKTLPTIIVRGSILFIFKVFVMELTGAEIAIRCLQEEGVEYIFGYPGGAVLHIYDALFQQDKVKHILVRHEQAAIHAADGYARSSEKVGVALVTSGPGITNAVTGIATAYMDSIPVVVISGQVPSYAIGEDAFQEVDAVGITRPCVKHNFLIKDVKDIAPTIKKAFYLAKSRSSRPGAGRYPQRYIQSKDHLRLPGQRQYPILQSGRQGRQRADQACCAIAAGSQAAR